MTKVKMSTDVKVSADQVWQAIGNFNALPDWHPGIEKSSLEEGGSVRRLQVPGGGEVVEKLEAHDDNSHTYTYSIVSAALPVMNYTATLRVIPKEDGSCEVEWSGQFEPAGAPEIDATKAVEQIYQAGLDNLRKMFGG